MCILLCLLQGMSEEEVAEQGLDAARAAAMRAAPEVLQRCAAPHALASETLAALLAVVRPFSICGAAEAQVGGAAAAASSAEQAEPEPAAGEA